LLAELGADAVQIESRNHPEALRSPAYAYGGTHVEPSGVPTTPLHAGLSRSTRGLALDLTEEDGRGVFRRLVRVADIVVENLHPTLLDRWRCSFDDLVRENPKLVMISLSGYGRTGPRADFRAYATNIANFVGLTAAWGQSHSTHTDYVAAEHAVVGALAALRVVARTGQGVWLDVAQIESAAATMAPLYLDDTANDRQVVPRHNEVPGSLLTGVYRSLGADRWLALELEDLDDWNRLVDHLQRPELRAETAHDAGVHREALDAAVGNWAAALSPHAAAHVLQRIGLAAGAVQDSEDVVRDPQLRTRGFAVEIDHPDLGVIEYAQSPHRMSLTPGRVQRRAPRLGEHTREVLREWLDLDGPEIDSLVHTGAAWQPDTE
jgi:crotonobetainyl-CoA:carnitine CoA-transferase CaiB-like acyl-CoA transferase